MNSPDPFIPPVKVENVSESSGLPKDHEKARSLRFSVCALFLSLGLLGLLAFFLRPLDWEGSLRRAVEGAEGVVIKSRNESDQAPILLHQRKDVLSILDVIEVDDRSSKYSCACVGDTLIQFVAGNEVEHVLTVHHGKHLRRIDGQWPCDAELTAKSAQELDDLFVRLGYQLPVAKSSPHP